MWSRDVFVCKDERMAVAVPMETALRNPLVSQINDIDALVLLLE